MSGGASFTLPRASARAGVLLTAGAGTLPDIDHPDSTISREFGFLTQAFAWLVDRLSGGHRHGTHSLVGIAVFSALDIVLARLDLRPRWVRLGGPAL